MTTANTTATLPTARSLYIAVQAVALISTGIVTLVTAAQLLA